MPIPSFDDDLAYVLQDVGEIVVYGTQKDFGLLNDTAFDGTDPAGFELHGTARTLMVRDGAFTGLTQDTGITHAGVDYTIKDIGNVRTDGLRALVVIKATGPAPTTGSGTFGGATWG